MGKGTIWFWYKGYYDDKYHIYSGDIYNWIDPWTHNVDDKKSPVAKIRVNNGMCIHLPSERLFSNKEECKTYLRDKLINEILIK